MGPVVHSTREAWLIAATSALDTDLLAPNGYQHGEVRVSCGWPARGALSASKRRIGECWHRDGNADGHAHIFVSPVLSDHVTVLATLLHELLHASLPLKAKHGKTFAKAATRVGLEGKPTATTASAALAERLNALRDTLGDYPHASIDATSKLKKQTTRMRLYLCQCEPDKSAGITNKVRVASDHWQATCDRCGAQFAQDGDGELDTDGERD